MKTRPSLALAVTALVIAVATACTPGATPTTTPTPTFSTEAEAFAAAEATYRAYVDAVNKRWASTDSTPDPQDFLIGSALEDDIDAQRRFNEQGIHFEGEVRVQSVVPETAKGGGRVEEVTLTACLNYEAARVIDQEGENVTPTERPNNPLEVDLTVVGDAFVISRSRVSEDGLC